MNQSSRKICPWFYVYEKPLPHNIHNNLSHIDFSQTTSWWTDMNLRIRWPINFRSSQRNFIKQFHHDCWWFRNPAVAPVEVGSWNPRIYRDLAPSKRWWLLDFWTINSTKATPQRNPPSSSSGFVLDPYSAQRNAAKTTTKKIHG